MTQVSDHSILTERHEAVRVAARELEAALWSYYADTRLGTAEYRLVNRLIDAFQPFSRWLNFKNGGDAA